MRVVVYTHEDVDAEFVNVVDVQVGFSGDLLVSTEKTSHGYAHGVWATYTVIKNDN